MPVGRMNLLNEDAAGFLQLVVAGRRADEDHLVVLPFVLLERHRAVVERAWQAEAVLDEAQLPCAVAVVHSPHLRQRHMTLVHDQEVVVREVVEEAVGALAGWTSGEMAAVVLDAGAVADLLHHLDVEERPLLQALRRHHVALVAQHGQAPPQLLLNRGDGALHLIFGRDENLGWVDRQNLFVADRLPGQRVDHAEGFDLVAPERDAVGDVFEIRWENLHHVAAHAEGTRRKFGVVPGVEDAHQIVQQLVPPDLLLGLELDDLALVLLGRAQAVDARDARHHDHVRPTGDERTRGPQPEAVDPVVDRHVLLDVGIRVDDVGLGLVVVVVGDEELDGVIREELPELGVELGRERLVVAHHERRTSPVLDDVGHRKRVVDKEATVPGKKGLRTRYREVVDVRMLVVDGLHRGGGRPAHVAQPAQRPPRFPPPFVSMSALPGLVR